MLTLSVLLTALTLVHGENLPECASLLGVHSSTPRIWFLLINLDDLQYSDDWNLEIAFSKPVTTFQMLDSPSSVNRNASAEAQGTFHYLPNLSSSPQLNSRTSFTVRRTLNNSLGLASNQKWSFSFFAKIKYNGSNINVTSVKYNDITLCQTSSEATKRILNFPCGENSERCQFLAHYGEDTKPGDWPWLVAIYVRTSRGHGTSFQCAGSLISNKHVITAVHCLENVLAEDIVLILGKHNLFDLGMPEGSETRLVDRFVIHPNWVPPNKTRDHDIAVLFMSENVNFSNLIYPVCLWNPATRNVSAGTIGSVVGWGLTEDKELADTPMLVEMPLVTNEDCKNSNVLFEDLVTDFNFCAGNRNGSGPCNGDSGGGMFVPEPSPLGGSRWVLRGIVSRSLLFGRSCDLRNYVIFTDMTKFFDWVIQVIENNS